MRTPEKIILDLCGGSGSWSKPYRDAGYDVRLITLPYYDVLNYDPPDNVYGVLAAPPCVEFSCAKNSNLRTKNPSTAILDACMRIIKICNPKFWALENPKGDMRNYMGKPDMTFHPYQYGDAWTKKTDIWGIFNIPEAIFTWETCPKLDLYVRPGRKKPSIAALHKSSVSLIPQFACYLPVNDAAFRAITPPGFARAFFEANK